MVGDEPTPGPAPIPELTRLQGELAGRNARENM